jgi:hypothetical protein
MDADDCGAAAIRNIHSMVVALGAMGLSGALAELETAHARGDTGRVNELARSIRDAVHEHVRKYPSTSQDQDRLTALDTSVRALER